MRTAVPVKRVAAVSYGLGQPPALSDVGVPIIRATNISRGLISGEGMIFAGLSDLPLDRAPLITADEILVVRSGAYTGDSARVGPRWAGSSPGYDLRVTPRSVDSRYLAWVFLSGPWLDQVNLAKQRAAQPHLNAEDVGETTVPMHDLAEQRAIADFLDVETARIDLLIARQRQLLAALDLRWEAFVETLLGDSPPHPVKRFATKIGSGSTPTGGSEVYVSEGVRFLRSQNVRDGQVDLSDVVHITSDQDAELQRTRLRTGDVLLNITGGSIGRTALVTESVLPANVSQHVCLIRCRRGVDPLLVQVSLQSRMVQDQIRLVQVGGNREGLNFEQVGGLLVRLPGSSSQAEAINTVYSSKRIQRTALEDRQRRAVELLLERKQALIAAAVTGQLDLARESVEGAS